MLAISNLKCKLIMFKSGKFRIMGKIHPTQKIANLELRKFYRYLPKTLVNEFKQVKQLFCQTVTVTFDLNRKLNLPNLVKNLNLTSGFFCELEIFPALMLKLWSPVHVNIFASGKVVLTGIKPNNF